jgi:hypothetical protein
LEYVRRTTGRPVRYYPTSLLWYVAENGGFFTFFIFIRFVLKDSYIALQATYVVLMLAVVIFDTYAILRLSRTSK